MCIYIYIYMYIYMYRYVYICIYIYIQLINDGWLMIGSGILLPNILGIIIIQERGIPINLQD